MQDIQEIWGRIQQIKKQQKDLRGAYKDALKASQEYVELTEKLTTMRARKKQIEATVKGDFASDFTKLDDLKIDLESDMEILSDIAMTKLMKGETVEVKDEYDNVYEPIFSVKFKKT